MIHQGKCKFCGQTLHLEVDDSYLSLKDPFKLLRLAACNRCGDLRVTRRMIHAALIKVCSEIIANHDAESRQQCQKIVESLTKKYLELISDWTGHQLVWEEAMTSPIMAAPKFLGAHLKRFWNLTKQQRLGI